jgi:hypothetical protein
MSKLHLQTTAKEVLFYCDERCAMWHRLLLQSFTYLWSPPPAQGYTSCLRQVWSERGIKLQVQESRASPAPFSASTMIPQRVQRHCGLPVLQTAHQLVSPIEPTALYRFLSGSAVGDDWLYWRRERSEGKYNSFKGTAALDFLTQFFSWISRWDLDFETKMISTFLSNSLSCWNFQRFPAVTYSVDFESPK